MGTVVEVRDKRGAVVTEHEGQVYIGGRLFRGWVELGRTRLSRFLCGAGGEDRVCLLDEEQTVAPGTMRATGDWVSVQDSQLYYLGRRDRLVKRHGKRVNLDSVQQVRILLRFVSLSTWGQRQHRRRGSLTFVSSPSSSSR